MIVLLSSVITLKERNKNNILSIDKNESAQMNEKGEVSPRNTEYTGQTERAILGIVTKIEVW